MAKPWLPCLLRLAVGQNYDRGLDRDRQRPRQRPTEASTETDRGLDRDRQRPRQRPTDRQTDRPTESRQTDRDRHGVCRDRHGVCIVPVRIGPTEVDRGRQRSTEDRQLSTDRGPTDARQGPDKGPTELDRARQTDSQGSKKFLHATARRPNEVRTRSGRSSLQPDNPTEHEIKRRGTRTRSHVHVLGGRPQAGGARGAHVTRAFVLTLKHFCRFSLNC